MSSDVNVQKKPSGTKAETKCCGILSLLSPLLYIFTGFWELGCKYHGNKKNTLSCPLSVLWRQQQENRDGVFF